MKHTPLHQHVLNLLDFKGAHLSFDEAVRGLTPEFRGKRVKGAPHTLWQLVEHMRIAQWDILEFSRNAKHQSPEFPEGYWPQSTSPSNDASWKKSIAAFRSDLEQMKRLVAEADEEELYQQIPHGEGQTLLREALLVADHNAYHLGQLVMLRKLLGTWK